MARIVRPPTTVQELARDETPGPSRVSQLHRHGLPCFRPTAPTISLPGSPSIGRQRWTVIISKGQIATNFASRGSDDCQFYGGLINTEDRPSM
jgi:hypothetical protein